MGNTLLLFRRPRLASRPFAGSQAQLLWAETSRLYALGSSCHHSCAPTSIQEATHGWRTISFPRTILSCLLLFRQTTTCTQTQQLLQWPRLPLPQPRQQLQQHLLHVERAKVVAQAVAAP